MSRPRSLPGPLMALLTALLVTVAFTGCIGDEEGDGRFASYDEAKAAVTESYEPVNGSSSVRLGLISPEDPSRIGTGGVEVVVLLFDSEADEPVTDAEFRIQAMMPAMGHGTDPETNPSHDAHGVYVGSTTITMGGTWMINLDPTLADGTQLEFDLEVQAEGDGGMGGMDGGMDHGGNATPSYGSYQEAKDAPGDTYTPEDGNSSLEIKLLAPHPPTNLSTGQTHVQVLLFDSETDEPVTDANVTLDAIMTAMGHGTSPEEDPTHDGYGVYTGMTTFSMNGTWLLEIEASLSDGSTLTWGIEALVGHGGMQMQEPPEGYNETYEDTVSQQDYAKNWTFPLNWTPAKANLTLAVAGTPLSSVTDELTLTVFDPNGTEIDSISVAGGSSGSLTLSDLNATGAHTAQVSGNGVEASYTLDIAVDYLPEETMGDHDHGGHEH